MTWKRVALLPFGLGVVFCCLLGADFGVQYVRQCDGRSCRLVAVPSPVMQGTILSSGPEAAEPAAVASGAGGGSTGYSVPVSYSAPVMQSGGGSGGYAQATYSGGYTSPYNGVTYRSRFAARRPVAAGVVRGAGRLALAPARLMRRVFFGRRR